MQQPLCVTSSVALSYLPLSSTYLEERMGTAPDPALEQTKRTLSLSLSLSLSFSLSLSLSLSLSFSLLSLTLSLSPLSLITQTHTHTHNCRAVPQCTYCIQEVIKHVRSKTEDRINIPFRAAPLGNQQLPPPASCASRLHYMLLPHDQPCQPTGRFWPSAGERLFCIEICITVPTTSKFHTTSSLLLTGSISI